MMDSRTVHGEHGDDVVTVLDRFRRASLGEVAAAEDLSGVVRRVVPPEDAEKAPSVPVAAFSSFI